MHDEHFYRNIEPFRDFAQLADAARFHRVPDSWSVLITDVQGSTRAIKEGRYKDVNLIGAASITCVLNVTPGFEVPFVFGGDGATLLLPDSLVAPAAKELRGLQALAEKHFGLRLRAGHVLLSTLRQHGTDLFIGKYELSPGNFTAQLKGGAISMAEDMIKKEKPAAASKIEPDDAAEAPRLEGLSCRLQPLENRKGLILSLLVKPVGSHTEENLRVLLSRLKDVLNGDFLSARPVSLDRLSWRWPPASIAGEVKMRMATVWTPVRWIQILLRTLISAFLLTFNMPLGSFKPRKYKGELVTNSDFKKYDETLRMVIDCTEAQAATIQSMLNELKDQGKIIFGVHRSSKALMTCMVKSTTANRHIHFVDGSDGGYALAAEQLKREKA